MNADLKDFRERVEGLGNNVRRRTPLDGEAGGKEEHPTDKVVDSNGEETGNEDGVGGENIDEPTPNPDPTPRPPATPGSNNPGGENASPAGTTDPVGAGRAEDHHQPRPPRREGRQGSSRR